MECGLKCGGPGCARTRFIIMQNTKWIAAASSFFRGSGRRIYLLLYLYLFLFLYVTVL